LFSLAFLTTKKQLKKQKTKNLNSKNQLLRQLPNTYQQVLLLLFDFKREQVLLLFDKWRVGNKNLFTLHG